MCCLWWETVSCWITISHQVSHSLHDLLVCGLRMNGLSLIVLPPRGLSQRLSVCNLFCYMGYGRLLLIPNSLFLRENIPQFLFDLMEFTAAFPRFSFTQKGVFTANLRLSLADRIKSLPRYFWRFLRRTFSNVENGR